MKAMSSEARHQLSEATQRSALSRMCFRVVPIRDRIWSTSFFPRAGACRSAEPHFRFTDRTANSTRRWRAGETWK